MNKASNSFLAVFSFISLLFSKMMRIASSKQNCIEDGDTDIIGKDLYHCDFLTSNNKKCNKKYKTNQGLRRHIKHKMHKPKGV